MYQIKYITVMLASFVTGQSQPSEASQLVLVAGLSHLVSQEHVTHTCLRVFRMPMSNKDQMGTPEPSCLGMLSSSGKPFLTLLRTLHVVNQSSMGDNQEIEFQIEYPVLTEISPLMHFR